MRKDKTQPAEIAALQKDNRLLRRAVAEASYRLQDSLDVILSEHIVDDEDDDAASERDYIAELRTLAGKRACAAVKRARTTPIKRTVP